MHVKPITADGTKNAIRLEHMLSYRVSNMSHGKVLNCEKNKMSNPYMVLIPFTMATITSNLIVLLYLFLVNISKKSWAYSLKIKIK